MDIENYLSHNGQVSNATVKETAIVAFYFSAHWCGPCRDFTPILSKFYEIVNNIS